ncbi:lipoxygenase LoxA [Nematostella vectensis]|uniref:lipoxygenase LoxA n=1 Tax=Nematostella vectensis TaxID=45351 RepID=UPI00207712C2|nr:lipoxygenase LoxA [Nematostella vectensis]XP_032242855.2 lipoxygenase LoxA [Nematostella vectensis]
MKTQVVLLFVLLVLQSTQAAPVVLETEQSSDTTQDAPTQEAAETAPDAVPQEAADAAPEEGVATEQADNPSPDQTSGSPTAVDSSSEPDQPADVDSEVNQKVDAPQAVDKEEEKPQAADKEEEKSQKEESSPATDKVEPKPAPSEAEGSSLGGEDVDPSADKCKDVTRCKNGGTCVNDYNKIDGYYCDCAPDFGGLDCGELKCRVSLPEKTSKICALTRQIGRNTKKMLIKLTSARKDDSVDRSSVQVPQLLKKAAASFVQSASTDPFTIEWYMKMTDNADLNKDIESHFTLKDPRFHTTPNLIDFAIVYEAFYKHHKKYSAMSALKRVPSIEDNFYKDRCFADQRLAGANPFQIWRVTRSSANVGVGWDTLYEKLLNRDFDWHKAFRKVLETDDNDALDKAIDAGQMYVTFYPELEGLNATKLQDLKFNHTVSPLTAPIAMFVVKEAEPGVKRLTPVAIQGDAHGKATVYTPEEGKGWFYAKAMVQRADINVLHMIKKRLKTHLYLDAPCTLVEKYFSEYHPLHQMLRYHCRANLETNKLFELKLYGEKAPIYKALSIDYDNSVRMVNKEYGKMDFSEIDLVEELKKRGVDDDKLLPYYPYRDDGKKLYSKIKEFVHQYIRLYYKDDDDVKKDFELQEFANEMSMDGKGDDGGLGMIKKFPAKISNATELSSLLTTLMWAMIGQHAATTYPIQEYGGFVPNSPHRLFADENGEDKYSTLMFGNKTIALEVAELSSNVASIHLDSLFDYYSKMEDKDAKSLVHRFYESLDSLSKDILTENDQRVRDGLLPYPYFLPGFVSNSAST